MDIPRRPEMKPIPGTKHFAGADGNIYSRMGRGVNRTPGGRWKAVVFLGGGNLKYAYFPAERDADEWVAEERAKLGQDGWRRIGTHDTKGYITTTLKIDGVYKTARAHRLVALAWHGPPPDDKAQIRHLNGVRDDNRPCNIAWGTFQENMDDRAAHRGETRRSK